MAPIHDGMEYQLLEECAMKIDLGPSSFNLPRDGVVSLREAAGARVVCLSGAVWLTQQGSDEDVILEAGERFRIANTGLTLITALRGSELCVVQPCTTGSELMRRIRTLLPGSLSRMLPST
jgi:hypothetical protein